jgi:F-type H+-transporting ATPase subunit c
MDSATIIAVVSIATAGITTGFGCMGPALGEGRSVASAMTSLAQQPDAAPTITRTLFVGLAMIESTAIYTFVVSMILIFANPFWNHFLSQGSDCQLPHPGVVVEAFSLQTHPRCHRRTGEANRR